MEAAGPGEAVRGVPAYRVPHPWGAAVPAGNKEKEAKRKIRKGTPVETAAAVEITEDAARLHFMISTAAWKSLLAFPQLPQARRRSIKQ